MFIDLSRLSGWLAAALSEMHPKYFVLLYASRRQISGRKVSAPLMNASQPGNGSESAAEFQSAVAALSAGTVVLFISSAEEGPGLPTYIRLCSSPMKRKNGQ